MNNIIDEIIDYYFKKGIFVTIVEETEISYKLNIRTFFGSIAYDEDLEIIKSANRELFKSNIDYLIHNSLYRFLGE